MRPSLQTSKDLCALFSRVPELCTLLDATTCCSKLLVLLKPACSSSRLPSYARMQLCMHAIMCTSMAARSLQKRCCSE